MTQVILCNSVSTYKKYLNATHRRMRDLPLVQTVNEIPFGASVLVLGEYDVLSITNAAKVRFVEL